MAAGKSCDRALVPTRETGQFYFRVRFSPAKDDPISLVASSVVAGYQCEVYYVRIDSANKLISLILQVHHDSNPAMEGIKVIPSMVLLDRTRSPSSMGTGSRRFCQDYVVYTMRTISDDVKATCVVDDYFAVMCSVEVIRDMDWTQPEEDLSNLGHDLAPMFDKEELTDFSFAVDGESFSAHRLVLAARSPVFRAELYGPMAESKMTSITIQEMRASTFRSMLHYMYHGSLPKAGNEEYQGVLVAADRYGVERLKKICEDKLCGNSITKDNVVSMLELADRHVCPKLKAGCLDFISDGENFKMVATTDAYFSLMQRVPSLLVEVRNRFKIAHEKPTIMEPGAHKKTRTVTGKCTFLASNYHGFKFFLEC